MAGYSEDVHPFVTQDEQSMQTSSEEYHNLFNELHQAIAQAHPDDLLQFCASFFLKKLETERAQTRQHGRLSSSHPTHPSAMDHDHHGAGMALGGAALGAGGAAAMSTSDDDDDDEDRDFQDEERDTVGDDLPSLAIPPSRGRRTSVSAESIQPSHNVDYVKTVIPKSDEQRDRIRTAIGNNFLFKNLDEDQYMDVVNAMAEKRVSEGVQVIEQGAVGDYFYIVESGTFDCFIDGNLVTKYDAGGSFGELALMYNAPRAATITATSDAVLWALDRVTFRSILMENTARKRRMYEQFLEEVPILKSLDINERHKIADALEPVRFEDKDIVIREGDVGENFYLIESGEAIFYKTVDGQQQEVNRAGKGDYFGELALLNDSPRAATVVAHGRLKCATLGKKAFTRLLGPVMDILKRNSENYHAVLQQANQ
ncbi:cyclic nucleotide-binding-like protein [Radiomyces spectabilis]|uniref:cyclic nucleotide-binding-like protein n=1 Tax=Radiomyces spectabilis TaxID=64574 RepID=UPI00221EC352|nr:cyclic nucleotide-binding-like protein [Radiomyces spectabilis]KAI8384787.1 cyclic nucleotide-binding-like protein [Radiomyces spectabilis]